MPRLTQDDYLRNHNFLRLDRDSDGVAFSLLSAREQWDLFMYCLPHQIHRGEDLLAHRRSISETDRSLPHRAGRAFKHLLELQVVLPEYRAHLAAQPRVKTNAKKQVHVFSTINPRLAPEHVATIILAAARERAGESEGD